MFKCYVFVIFIATVGLVNYICDLGFEAPHFPMLWDHTKPFDAGVFQGYIGIETTSYGAMDDRLLILGE